MSCADVFEIPCHRFAVMSIRGKSKAPLEKMDMEKNGAGVRKYALLPCAGVHRTRAGVRRTGAGVQRTGAGVRRKGDGVRKLDASVQKDAKSYCIFLQQLKSPRQINNHVFNVHQLAQCCNY